MNENVSYGKIVFYIFYLGMQNNLKSVCDNISLSFIN